MTMRRSFMGASAGVIASLFFWRTGTSVSAAGIRGIRYRDYDVFFTGWKRAKRSRTMAGQWLAWPLLPDHAKYDTAGVIAGRRKYYYVNCPSTDESTQGEYVAGQQFNVVTIGGPWSGAITWDKHHELHRFELDSLARMLKLLDRELA